MKIINTKIIVSVVIVLLGLSGYLVLRHSREGAAKAGESAIILYQCSMHPWVKSDSPGKCTICGMDLSPVSDARSGPAAGGVVSLSQNNITVLNVQSEAVRRQPLERVIRVAGTLEPVNSRVFVISAPAAGRIASLDVDYVGAEVQAGQAVMSLLSPDLAQKRQYLRIQAGLIGQSGQPNKAMNAALNYEPASGEILAQQPGTVTERNVSVGQYVTEGEKLLTIVDMSVLWFRFDVYEQQLAWVRPGLRVEVRFAALPEKVFTAAITFIEPVLNDATRTVKVRADIENPAVASYGRSQRQLQLGMYGEGRVISRVDKVLGVARTAILFSGPAAYAYVDKGGGNFERRRVALGRQGDQVWEVLRGLREGERVVTSGNVLLDAQAQLSQGSQPQTRDEADEPAAPEAYAGEAPAAVEKLKPAALKALDKFFAVSSGFSEALAADDFGQFNQRTAGLPAALTELRNELGDSPAWREAVSGLSASGGLRPAKDLVDARRQFHPFSTSAVSLLQLARAREDKLRPLKVYYCPMAKPPGLWLQQKGPLRNPYYGSEMLTCGEEVPAPARLRSRAVAKQALPPGAAPAVPAPGMKHGEDKAMMPAAAPAVPAPSAPGMKHDGDRAMAFQAEVPAGGIPAKLQYSSVMDLNTALGGREPGPVPPEQSVNPTAAHRTARMVLSDNLRAQRRELALEMQRNKAAGTDYLTSVQRNAIEAFLEQADALALALSEEGVGQFNRVAVRLPYWIPTLQTQFRAGHRWNKMVADVAEVSRFESAADLAQARERFLPFTRAVTAWALRLRADEAAFKGLKIFKSPSAPGPGMWVQLKGPAHNPFFGAGSPEAGEALEL